MYRSSSRKLGEKGQTTTPTERFSDKDMKALKKIKNPCNEWKINNNICK